MGSESGFCSLIGSLPFGNVVYTSHSLPPYVEPEPESIAFEFYLYAIAGIVISVLVAAVIVHFIWPPEHNDSTSPESPK
jgi:membrane protease YdiL (CAAX protease family)